MNANSRRKFWKAGLLNTVSPKVEKVTVPETKKEVETKVEVKVEQAIFTESAPVSEVIVEQITMPLEEVVSQEPVIEEIKPKFKKSKKVVDETE